MRAAIRLASVSWPVVIQVSPQQASSSMTRTVSPAASSTRIAAWPEPGRKWSVKESAHTHTSGVSGSRAVVAERRRVRVAKVGSERRWSTPAVARASFANAGTLSEALTTGATGAASAAHFGNRPSSRWERGRRSVEPSASYRWWRASDL